MDAIKTSLSYQSYASLREVRQAKINKVLQTEAAQAEHIPSFSLEKQKELTSFYNEVLGDIYNIRNKHPLTNLISSISDTGTIDPGLHTVGPPSRALKEVYKDNNGVNSARVLWGDGTALVDKKLNDHVRSKVTTWPDGVINSQEYSMKKSHLPSDIPSEIKNYFQNTGFSNIPDINSLEKILHVLPGDKISENRTS